MSSFRDLKNAGIPKMSGILPRRILVFLWVFHKLVFTPLQVLARVSPLRSTFLREFLTAASDLVSDCHWSTALSVLPDNYPLKTIILSIWYDTSAFPIWQH